MENKITTYDIANKAGVNQGTVSRVLSGSTSISQKTIDKVMKVAKELNYVPNSLAKNLKANRSYSILVSIPFEVETFLGDPFIPEFLSGVNYVIEQHSYSTVISFAERCRLNDEDIVPLVQSRKVDGVIRTSPLQEDPLIKGFIKASIPFVTGRFDGDLGTFGACVDIDNVKTSYEATKYLISRGHKRIGLLTEPFNVIVAKDFYIGYLKAIKESKIKKDDSLVINIPLRFEDAFGAAKSFFSLKSPPTAILVTTCLAAFGARKYLSGVKAELPILTVNSPLWQFQEPSFPRIKAPIRELGMQMANSLINIIEKEQVINQNIILNSIIIDEYGKEYKVVK